MRFRFFFFTLLLLLLLFFFWGGGKSRYMYVRLLRNQIPAQTSNSEVHTVYIVRWFANPASTPRPQPQDTIPDVFIWMLCGGKRVAYTRIPAQHVVYSLVEEERGKDAGRMQTVFLRVGSRSSNRHTPVYHFTTKAICCRFWLAPSRNQ